MYIKKVLKVLLYLRLYAKLLKYIFYKKKVTFLRFIIRAARVYIEETRIKAISK